jgi:hypothetical protein
MSLPARCNWLLALLFIFASFYGGQTAEPNSWFSVVSTPAFPEPRAHFAFCSTHARVDFDQRSATKGISLIHGGALYVAQLSNFFNASMLDEVRVLVRKIFLKEINFMIDN